jgi:hypothetical protein
MSTTDAGTLKRNPNACVTRLECSSAGLHSASLGDGESLLSIAINPLYPIRAFERSLRCGQFLINDGDNVNLLINV